MCGIIGFLTLAATVFGGIASWFGIGSLPIDSRVALAATASLLAALPLSVVFNLVVRDPRAAWRKLWSAAAGLLLVAFAVWLVWLSVTYHSLVVDDQCQPSQPTWRCFGLAAPRHVVNLEWRFGVDGRPGTTAEWLPGFWSETLGTSTTEFDDRALTVRFTDFTYPQYYGVKYILNRADGTVKQQINDLLPKTTSQIRRSRLQVLTYSSIATGACVWPLASWFFYSSAPWWRRVNRRGR
jgi:hypothetical protein